MLVVSWATGVEALERAVLDRASDQAQAEARALSEASRQRARASEDAEAARAEARRQREEGRQQRAEGQYEAGQEALENAQWARAAERFRQVVDAKQTRVERSAATRRAARAARRRWPR
jgi:hypothetical protein